MLIDHRHKLTDSLPAVAAVVPNSSRLQKLMAEQLKEEIAVLEHHHAKAVSQLESVRSKGVSTCNQPCVKELSHMRTYSY